MCLVAGSSHVCKQLCVVWAFMCVYLHVYGYMYTCVLVHTHFVHMYVTMCIYVYIYMSPLAGLLSNFCLAYYSFPGGNEAHQDDPTPVPQQGHNLSLRIPGWGLHHYGGLADIFCRMCPSCHMARRDSLASLGTALSDLAESSERGTLDATNLPFFLKQCLAPQQ